MGVNILASIDIRDLSTYDEFLQVQELHQIIWGLPEGGGLYPPMLNTAAHNRGVVLGAFDGKKIVGFGFGFLGMHQDQIIKLCSQTVGILTSYRGRGIGTKIKWAQRERVLANGIPLITWTFDPLEARNAFLNLHKLGAVCKDYKANIYGENFSIFGKGMPSDRLLVEWWIKSKRVQRRLRFTEETTFETNVPIINQTQVENHIRLSSYNDLHLTNTKLYLEIPADIQEIRKKNLDLANDWRIKTRRIFQTYFSRGYQAVEIVRRPTNRRYRIYYLLQR
jgi:predicted GNAT superfamily acetyltransferase